MAENRKNLSRIVITIAFLTTFILGTILIFTTPTSVKITYSQSVETKDGVQISFNVFEPVNGEKEKKAVIIGHGIIVNKETLKSYAIELAAAGYLAVSIDFRGHGQSSGKLTIDDLSYDVKAVKAYLEERGDVDTHNLGYIGYSMGGFPGNELVKKDKDFKCFIGVGTGLEIEKDDVENRTLNILMILGQYDQAFGLSDLKDQFGKLIDKDADDVVVNRLYGCFKNGNAAKLYVDDNSDHLLTAWDEDFIREARDWVKNTFSDVDPVDEHFYVNVRLLIIIVQLIGGIGFFYLIIRPLSEILVKKKEGEVIKFEKDEETVEAIAKKVVIYSFAFLVPGLLIMLPILLLLPLMVAGLMVTLLFSQAFGMLIFLWKYGKKKGMPLLELLKKPFKISKDSLKRNILLGTILAILLYIILYLSVGLNYLGMAPSITKWLWIIPYFAVMLFIFLIYQMVFNVVIQPKVGADKKELFKGTLLAFLILYGYLSVIILIPCIILGNYFFAMFLEVAVFIHLLLVSTSTVLYKHSESIIPAAIVNSLFLILLLATLSPYFNILDFLSIMASTR